MMNDIWIYDEKLPILYSSLSFYFIIWYSSRISKHHNPIYHINKWPLLLQNSVLFWTTSTDQTLPGPKIPSSASMSSKCFVIMCQYCILKSILTPTRYGHLQNLVLCRLFRFVKAINTGAPIGSSDHSCISFGIERLIGKPRHRIWRTFHKAK